MSLTHQRTTLAVIALVLAAAGIAALYGHMGEAHGTPSGPAPATEVDVATVASRTMTDWHEYSGRLEAVEQVEIRPLVSGTLTAVHFADGATVQKGDPLFTIDPRPYQAAVDRATAQLAAAKARAAYTASDLARGKRLLAGDAIAKRDFEEKRNAANEAAANLQAAQAMLEAAALDLEHTRIVAPIGGRVSRAALTVGNVVAAGPAAAPLTSVVSTSRMYASFEMDEQSFLKVVNPARQPGGAAMPVLLGLGNETGYPRTGRLASIDNRLDTSSGTIRVRAIFDNTDGALVPGLYARIRLGGAAPRPAVLIDEKAIGTDQSKRFVLVVGEDDRTAYREVTLGASRNGLRVVEAGLHAGERIVVNGLQRVRPGDLVAPQRAASAATAPALADGSTDETSRDDASEVGRS